MKIMKGGDLAKQPGALWKEWYPAGRQYYCRISSAERRKNMTWIEEEKIDSEVQEFGLMDGKRDELADFANFLCQYESSIKRDQCQIVISATFSQQIEQKQIEIEVRVWKGYQIVVRQGGRKDRVEVVATWVEV